MVPEPVGVARVVADILEALGVNYLVGGSVASSLVGLPRTTLDVDIVADLDERHVQAFVARLGADFYADEDAIRDAVRRRASFNIIHLPTAFKVDVFVMRRDPYSRLEMSRRRSIRISDSPPAELFVPTPEDLILQKLDWFRRGGGVSDRQWNDVIGVVKINEPDLDRVYLAEWGERLGLSALLQLALAGKPPPRST